MLLGDGTPTGVCSSRSLPDYCGNEEMGVDVMSPVSAIISFLDCDL